MRYLYDRYKQEVIRTFYYWTKNYKQNLGDQLSPDDLAQETWARVLANIGKYDPNRGPLMSWVYGIAQRVFADAVKKYMDRMKHEYHIFSMDLGDNMRVYADIVAIDDDVNKRLEGEERWQMALEALGALPGIYKEAIILYYGYGLICREIAERLGISLSNVRVRLSRARRKMTEYVQTHWDE